MRKMRTRRTEWIGRNNGQTLIIAIIVLGVLLILGGAFAAIIAQSMSRSSSSQRRTVANDLAEAGARYAHYQLLHSVLGADWRPAPTPPFSVSPAGFTKDPDAMYLRPGSGLMFPGTNDALVDRGGPDGLGPYTRVFFERGRVLLRVRYAPSNYNAFATPTGGLRQSGKTRSYLVIESVGRAGRLLTGGKIDPTRLAREAVKVQNYKDADDLANSLGRVRHIDSQITASRKMVAFATTGINNYAMFITDLNHVARPADFGWPTAGGGGSFDSAVSVGAYFAGSPVRVAVEIGISYPEPNAGRGRSWLFTPGQGGFHSNMSLRIHGDVQVHLNAFLGEAFQIHGNVSAANDASNLELSRSYYDAGTDLWLSDWGGNPSTVTVPISITGTALDSRNPSFSTYGRVFVDGVQQPDAMGYPRGITYIEPPLMDLEDPQGGADRFLLSSRDSGRVINGFNLGRWGFGEGVYVDSPERGNVSTEDEREALGAMRSLPNDWMNPNNANSLGWQGPFYRPIGAYLKLRHDGFEIVRDSRSRRRFWRDPANGASTGLSTIRYRLRDIGGQVWTLNSIQHPTLANQPAASLSNGDFLNNGLPFNGVVYFEGDARVRGVIPTNIQLTVVSGGTIYVEGSITKGLITEFGAMLSTPSRSAISLIARDYITVNTTQFFAPGPGEDPKPKNADALPDTPNPIELDWGGPTSITLQAQFLYGPDPDPSNGGINPFNPITWVPYALRYAEWAGANAVGPAFESELLVANSADDNGPAFTSMDVGPTLGTLASYFFSRQLDFASAGTITYNAADPYFTPGRNIPIYGLGNPAINAYPKFETVGHPLVRPGTWSIGAGRRTLVPPGGNPEGDYALALMDDTKLRIRLDSVGPLPPKNYLAARFAIAPYDVRIEAAMYAQEGSFYVIPGNWFNMNSDDSREQFNAWVSATNLDQAQRQRFELFGNTPSVPFFAEPLDVRVAIIGAISQNVPAPIAHQSQWLQKWGWIPREIGGTGRLIPWQHVPALYNLAAENAVPNFTLVFDPTFATGSADGANPMRVDGNGWALSATPRLPVSPTLVFFGDEVNP